MLACPHRDLSTCDACVEAHPEIVHVLGVHYWISDPVERSVLRFIARPVREQTTVQGRTPEQEVDFRRTLALASPIPGKGV